MERTVEESSGDAQSARDVALQKGAGAVRAGGGGGRASGCRASSTLSHNEAFKADADSRWGRRCTRARGVQSQEENSEARY